MPTPTNTKRRLAFALAVASSMLAGAGAKWLADSLVKTGILTGTALGQNVIPEV